MQFNISRDKYSSDRVTINIDNTQKVESVKIYTTNSRCEKLFAMLACITGYATTILGTDGKNYVVNLRSLGNAFALAKKEQYPVAKSVKDTFAKLFFNEAEKALIRSEFTKELQTLILKNEGNVANEITMELRALNELFTIKRYLNTVQEQQRLYLRIREILLLDSKDLARERVNKFLPTIRGMKSEEFENLIDILRQIQLPKE